jgi:opacity protein-like surface antigen
MIGSNIAKMSVGSRKARSAARRNAAVGGIALALALAASTAVQAQTCSTLNSPVGNLNNIVGTTALVGGSIASSVSTVSTAFLTQSSAFVSAPPNPTPGQQGGGVWVRGVGGYVDVKSSSSSPTAFTVPASPGNNASGSINCNTSVHQTFAGVQVGRDIGKFNINGWNLHYGTTAGYMSADGDTSGSTFTNKVEVPFVGLYGAATYDRFFADLVVKGDYYQNTMNSSALNIFNQNFSAHGYSVAASAGYNFALQNNWFIEPSLGVVHSRAKVDAINLVGAPATLAGTTPVSGTLRLNDIETTIGRIGARVGTTVNYNGWVLQPFASVSVWHDFAGDVTGNYAACCSLVLTQGAVQNPASLTQAFSGQNIGTYGQYSLGLSGQLPGTGWLGFVRMDYRNGDRLEGLSGTGGIRYQFLPEVIAAPIVTKARGKSPVIAAPLPAGPVNWAGFYAGAFLGGAYGDSHWGITGFGAVDPKIGGIIGGGTVGYNFQAGMWVYGFEGDIAATNLKGSQACSPLLGSTTASAPFFNTTCTASADWIATAAGRVGITWERALLYVKGGAAWTDADYNLTCNNAGLNGTATLGSFANCLNLAGALLNGASASNSHVGYTVGFGSEFALTRQWSAKAEYAYMDFGNKNVTASDGTLVNLGLKVNQYKIGLNYRFSAQ